MGGDPSWTAAVCLFTGLIGHFLRQEDRHRRPHDYQHVWNRKPTVLTALWRLADIFHQIPTYLVQTYSEQEGSESAIWSTDADTVPCAFIARDRLRKMPSDDLATMCYIWLQRVRWYFQLVRRFEFSWHDAAGSNVRCESVTQVLSRRLDSSGVVGGVLSLTAEASERELGWVKPQFSETGTRLFWSGLLTMATCTQRNLSRGRLDMQRQLWRLLFLFSFSILLTLSVNYSTVSWVIFV